MASIDFPSDGADRVARDKVRRHWSGTYASTRHLDPLLMLSAVVLTGFGLLMIYSATYRDLTAAGGSATAFVNKQAVALLVGLVGMGVVMIPDYRQFRAWAPVAYGFSLVLLLAVLLIGTEVNGAKAWIRLGGFQLQPVELAKPALIAMLAALFHERREDALGLRALVEGLALAAAPMLLILGQPDFGSFMVFVAIVFGVLLLARVHVRYLVALALIGALSAFGALQLNILKQYQVERLTAFINPDAVESRGAGFNVNQAQIAVGSGQLTGQGFLNGSQTSLSYVPENHTDFIFTVVGEELGFMGSVLLLSAFGLLLWRGLRIAALSRDTFGTLLAGGVVAVFAFQLFINVGMAIGIMPVTGLPLPFVSYGGTSLIAGYLMIGLLQNVNMRRFA